MKNNKIQKDNRNYLRPAYQTSLDYIASVFLWQEDLSPKFPLVMFYAGRIQLVSILLWAQFNYATNQESSDMLTNFFEDVVDLISGLYLITKDPSNYTQGPIISMFAIYILFVIILTGILINRSKQGKLSMGMEKIFCFLGSIHNEVIYWYINIILLKILNLSDVQYNILGIQLRSDSAVSIIVLSIILIWNFAFCAVSVIFRFDPFKTDNLISSWTQNCQIICGIFKTLQSILLTCFQMGNFSIILFWIISMVLTTFQKYSIHSDFPFYHKLGMQSALFLNSLGLCVVFPAGLIYMIYGANKLSEMTLVYMEILLFIIVFKIGLEIYRRQLYSSLNNIFVGVKDTGGVFKTMQALNSLFEHAKLSINSQSEFESIDEHYFFSIMKMHSEGCKDRSCACRLILLNDGKTPVFSLSKLKNQIHEIYNDILFDFFKKSAENLKSHRISIYLSYLEHSKSLSGRKALVTLFSIPRRETSYVLRIGLDKLNVRLKDKLNKFYIYNVEKVLNLSQFFQFQQISTSLLDLIDSASQDYLNYWSLFLQSKIKSSKINFNSHLFEVKADQIEVIWDRLCTDYPFHSKTFALDYSRYLTFYRNSTVRAEKLMKSYNDWLKKTKAEFVDEFIVEKNLMDQRNVVIYISMKKERLGSIVDMSTNIKLFGYRKDELIGKNINTLMPNCLQQSHQGVLQNHIAKNHKDDKLFRNIQVFGRKKQGTIMPLQAYFAVSPQFHEELIYMGLFREIRNDKDFIILNDTLEIDGFSHGIYNRFQNFNSSLKLVDIFESIKDIEKFIQKTRNGPSSAKTSTDFEEHEKDYTEQIYLRPKRVNSEAILTHMINTKISRVTTLGTHFYCLELTYEKTNKSHLFFEQKQQERKSRLFEDVIEGEECDVDEDVKVKSPDYAGPDNLTIFPNKDKNFLEVPFELTSNVIRNSVEFEEGSSIDFDIDEDLEVEVKAKMKSLKRTSASSIGSVSQIKAKNSRIEAALFEIPPMRILSVLYWFFIWYGLQTLSFIIIYSFILSNELIVMEKELRFVYSITTLAEKMDNFVLVITLGELSEAQVIEDYRYSETLTNEVFLKNEFEDSLKVMIRNIQQNITFNGVRIPKKNDQIGVRGLDSLYEQRLNFQEFYRILVASALRIDKSSDFSSSRLVDRKFILENAHQMLLLSEDITAELIRLCKNETAYSKSLLLTFLTLTTLSGFGGLILYFYTEFRLVLNQTRLYEGLSKINHKNVEELVSELTANMSATLMLMKTIKISDFKDDKVKKSLSKKTIELDHRRKDFGKVALIIIITTIYIVSFVILEVRKDTSGTSDNMQDNISHLELMIDIDLSIQEMIPLTLQTVLDKNLTHLNSQELDNQWNKVYYRLTALQTEFSMMMDDFMSSSTTNQMIKGNLCEEIRSQDVCDLDSRFISNGIYGLNNALINMLSEIRQLDMQISGTPNSTSKILDVSTFRAYEKIMLSPLNTVYEFMISRIMDQTMLQIQAKLDEELIYSLVYAVVIMILLVISKYYVINPIFERRVATRKLLRMIPVKLIMSNNFIKAYLRRNCSEQYSYLFK